MRSLPQTLVLAIGCLSLLPLAAQQIKPTLEIRTASGQTTFHIGERIPISLTLTGPNNKKYAIDTASYDRSGRLTIDSFEASPKAGWSDPLEQYFSHGFFDGGGLRGDKPLSSEPVTFTADLNEQIRFDQPGTYTITATSHRVGTLRGDDSFPREPYLALVSNPIEIHIIPATPEWQAEKLRSIVAILAKPNQHDNLGTPTAERAAAVADLRFLNSPAAIEVLAMNLREDSSNDSRELKWAAGLGLSGVPDSLRDTALHALSRRLEEPDFPVTGWFLTIMAGLEAGPDDTSDELQASRLKTVWQLAFAGLTRKRGAARAATAETLLSEAQAAKVPDAAAQIAAIVASTFVNLPIDRQMWNLENNWEELSKQAILPALQSILHQGSPNSRNAFYTAADLRAIAIRRWYDLDPEGALHELTVQLASSDSAFPTQEIASLPGGPQPQFEARWARELVESEDDWSRETLLAALLVRFGTGTATVQVESKLNTLTGHWACEPQAAALAYVVKFNSDNAASLVQWALDSTAKTACYEQLFSSISNYAHGVPLDGVAIAALHNPAPGVAADAARYLKSFGPENAKQPLLERYREWSETWAGKPAEVDPKTDAGARISDVGGSLGEALLANQAWIADPPLIAEVQRRCVGEQMCINLRRLASEASSRVVSVYLSGSTNNLQGSIGPFSTKYMDLFEAKLDQYPKDTKFTLTHGLPQNAGQEKLEREAEATFTKHGMTLEILVLPPSQTPLSGKWLY